MTTSPFSDLDERLSADLARLTGFVAGETLRADITAQVRAMDDVEQRDTGARGRRSLQVRRAAIDLIALAVEPGRGVTCYTGGTARSTNYVSARPQFIACFSTTDRGVVAVKSYGTPHPLEAAALIDCAEAAVPGVIQLFDSGETAFGSWLELPYLANAQSLAEVFTPPLDAPQTHRYPDGRLTRHRRFDQPVDPEDSLGPTSRVARLLAAFHATTPRRRAIYPHVQEVLNREIPQAEHNLRRSRYLPMATPAMEDFVRRWVVNRPAVFSHGDPFPPNVLVEAGPDGPTDTLIDVNPSFAPRGFDAARWITRIGDPTNLRPVVAAYLDAEEDIPPAEIAACLAADAYRFAGDLEAIKIETGAADGSGPPDDLETIALLETSNILRRGVEREQIRTIEDLFRRLDAVTDHVHEHADPDAENAGVARVPCIDDLSHCAAALRS